MGSNDPTKNVNFNLINSKWHNLYKLRWGCKFVLKPLQR